MTDSDSNASSDTRDKWEVSLYFFDFQISHHTAVLLPKVAHHRIFPVDQKRLLSASPSISKLMPSSASFLIILVGFFQQGSPLFAPSAPVLPDRLGSACAVLPVPSSC